MPTISELPWRAIAPPDRPGVLTLRRVSDEMRWDAYWALDAAGDAMFVLTTPETTMTESLPRLRRIEVSIRKIDDRSPALVVRLLDASLVGLFYRLCADILDAISMATTAAEAVGLAVRRLWRWHRLLRAGAGALSESEQKGLIGELLVLERTFIPAIGPAAAIAAWQGPLDAPQDFRHGTIRVECKTRTSRGSPTVRISSEHQLDVHAPSILYLHVGNFDRASAGTDRAFTINDAVNRIHEVLAHGPAHATERFAGLLTAAGFDEKDDYAGYLWAEGDAELFTVADGFPRLVPAGLPAGVAEVRYTLALPDCVDYVTPMEELDGALRRFSGET